MNCGRTYLITGGAGFIGSHLAEACLAEGHAVRVLDDLSTGSRDNLAGLDVDLVVGDVRDEATVREAVGGVDGVFHLAALPSVPRSIAAPYRSHDVNVNGTLRVLIAARDAGAKVVLAGSSSAYGDAPELPKREDMPVRPKSPYAASKVAAEQYLQVFAAVYGLPAAVVRYFNVYGPRQRADSPYSGVIARFCRAALHDEVCRVDGDGRQSRDFTYVEDAVRGTLLAMEADLPGGEVLNLAGGKRYSVLDLLGILEDLLGRPVRRAHGDPRPGDVRHSQASVDKAAALLGFSTAIDFHTGLARTLDWYRSRAAEGAGEPRTSS